MQFLAMAFFPLALAAPEAAPALHLTMTREHVTFLQGDYPLLRYRYAGIAYKPYADRLWTPRGVNVLRDAPADHPHHHGLMYAITAEDVNFWEEQLAPGRQEHQRWSDATLSEASAGATESLRWVDPARDGVLLLDESRRIEALDADASCTLLNWQSTLSAAREKGAVVLTGTHYHGLGMRFAASMDEGSAFLFSDAADGEEVRGSEKLTPGRWCAIQGRVDEQPVTVAVFDHPQNPRPALWFTMNAPFAYVSATMNLHREPLTVRFGAPFTVQYGVAAFDGKAGREQIQPVYEQWLAATDALVSH